MKKTILLLSFLSVSLLFGALKKGHQPGKWSQDLEAVKAYAKKNNKDIFINFTGSDWCGWCIHMDGKIFSQDQWISFSRDNLALLFIDFPQNQELVPHQFKNRNQRLSSIFGVSGYPSFFLVDSSFSMIKGIYSADQEGNPQRFIASVKNGMEQDQVKVFSGEAQKMPAPEKNNYQQLIFKLKDSLSFSLKNAKGFSRDAYYEVLGQLAEVKEQATVKMLPPAQSKKYQSILNSLNKADTEFNAWAQTRPERNEANTKIYEGFIAKFQKLEQEKTALEKTVF